MSVFSSNKTVELNDPGPFKKGSDIGGTSAEHQRCVCVLLRSCRNRIEPDQTGVGRLCPDSEPCVQSVVGC